MKRLFCAVLSVSCCVLGISAHADNRHFDKEQNPKIKVEKVAGNIYMLQGGGGNIGASVGMDGILIVDDDYKLVSEKLRDALKKLGSESPRFIFNTHWHSDHTEGNFLFGKSSIIIAHENVRQRLSRTNIIFGKSTEPFPLFALPVITYPQTVSVHFNGEEIRAVHFPNSHTDGDSVIFFTKSNVVHLGDCYFVGRFPFVDMENGGTVEGLKNTIGTLLKQIPADAKIIPGHGKVSTLEDLKVYHQMLVETSEIVLKAMKKKKTLDEIKKAGLPAKFSVYVRNPAGTAAWIETIYKSYSKK